jgi:hypothetical protein
MKTSFKVGRFNPIELRLCKRNQGLLLLVLFIGLFASCDKDDKQSRNCDVLYKEKKTNSDGKNTEPTISVFARGFNNPRGLKFGPDCYLYVAEAGLGGTRNTSDICPEIQPSPVAGGPFLGSPMGGRVSKGQRLW